MGATISHPASTLRATQTLVSGHLTAMPGEGRDELVERILAQLSDSERRSLEETAEAFDKVAREVGVDVVTELKEGATC